MSAVVAIDKRDAVNLVAHFQDPKRGGFTAVGTGIRCAPNFLPFGYACPSNVRAMRVANVLVA